jgi:hypothetical protein
MPDPATNSLTAVGLVAIVQGAKFLYCQSSELPKWQNESRKAVEGTPYPGGGRFFFVERFQVPVSDFPAFLDLWIWPALSRFDPRVLYVALKEMRPCLAQPRYL